MSDRPTHPESAESAGNARSLGNPENLESLENGQRPEKPESPESPESPGSAQSPGSGEDAQSPGNPKRPEDRQSPEGSESGRDGLSPVSPGNADGAAAAGSGAAQAPAQDIPVGVAPGAGEPGGKRVRRGRVAAVAGAVLLVGAVVAGGAYTVVTVRDADRDAGAPSWKFPAPAKAEAGERKPASPLAAMLVPYGDDYVQGPDMGRFGSDAALSGGEAAALRKEGVRDLPRSQRRRIEKEIDKQHTKGMAMRSYLYSGSTRKDDGTFTVSVQLAQIEDKRAVRTMSTFQNGLLDALSIFRSGPRIEGHKNAKCFLPPKAEKQKLDMMLCSAYQGDVLVQAVAYAAKPMNTKGVAHLLREQLDRIQEPGEAV
ncbi:hypothetical protein ACGFS9_29580 [Streptomyces sp. NPDC048566]|uniref:hypothetical protein n=1 Tax=Streptomyces sp. NPDC048566 TaxID=3365569 RepID=UPI0037226A74